MFLWPKNTWGRRIAVLILALVIAATHYTRTTSSVLYGDLELDRGTEVERVRVVRDGNTVWDAHVGRSGETIEFHITAEDFVTPWTLYLPFHQRGTVIGRFHFEARLGDKVVGRSSVSCENRVVRYGVLPSFYSRDDVRAQLGRALVKTAEVRLQEARRR